MIIRSELDIIRLIEKDQWMIEILQAVKSLELSDNWVCAGFVRSKVWDTLHGFEERTPIPDIDVIYFDKDNIDEMKEKILEEKLRELIPNIPWSVKNQARMHVVNNFPPYSSSFDAISKFPETATALGVKLNEEGKVILIAPHGIADVINLELKPTPYFVGTQDLIEIYRNRMFKKRWKSIWPMIKMNSL
ncbi:nucleotidyltransferase family protein [Bacillus sp. FJAT-49705]|uniref:Nucleotidyltransferase family protein n=1 Tax=Cytobacillus citreus TaxID=2833586 RepID=A0ABS5NQE5_9BACI|nr:nucleotidyltransferase family protein [Cytobacillus citreus]MBS4189689.1 nucleotidyltransferase family protein [Cytobacillus citreus]